MSPSESQERLDRLRESADASARNFRTVYVSYLVIALYILVIISSTDHDLLFRAGDVQAPVINVGMPVVWFFTFVPWILLFLHFNLMLQGTFLARKVSAFRAAGFLACSRLITAMARSKVLIMSLLSFSSFRYSPQILS